MTTGVTLVNGVSGISVGTGGSSTPVSNGATTAASQAFVNQQILYDTATVPLAVTGGVISQFTAGTGLQVVVFASGGVISSIVSIVTGGTGYAVGDSLLITAGNYDARVLITNVSAGVVQSGGVSVLYGGTGYSTGVQAPGGAIPIGQRSVVLAGVLTSNLTYILTGGGYNLGSRRPMFSNNTTGAFTTTVKLSNGAGGTLGSGVVLTQGTNNSTAQLLWCDGVNDVWKVA